VDEMNKLVEAVDTEDPWVKETFGVTGTGEGVVWYPVGLDAPDGTMPVLAPTPHHFTHPVFSARHRQRARGRAMVRG
jgi:hypothetical protein